MKIEVGKSYRTRDGAKATVRAKTDGSFPFKVVVNEDYDERDYTVNASGLELGWTEPTGDDLVAIWGDQPDAPDNVCADIEARIGKLAEARRALKAAGLDDAAVSPEYARLLGELRAAYANAGGTRAAAIYASGED